MGVASDHKPAFCKERIENPQKCSVGGAGNAYLPRREEIIELTPSNSTTRPILSLHSKDRKFQTDQQRIDSARHVTELDFVVLQLAR